MDLRNLKAVIGLFAKGTGTRQGVTWSAPVGSPAENVEWSGVSPVLYTVELSGITASGGVNPILDLSDGTVTADGATVTGAGVDFEGNALPAMDGVLAILLERLDTDVETVSVEDTGSSATIWHLGAANRLLHLTTATETPRLADLVATLTFTALGAPSGTLHVRVTVLALPAA